MILFLLLRIADSNFFIIFLESLINVFLFLVVMRIEFKYLVHESRVDELLGLLDVIGKKDKHCVNGSYEVLSLYFDSVDLVAFNEKAEGLFSREKFRVRFLKNTTVLEKKCKAGILGWKERYFKKDGVNKVFLDFKNLFLKGYIYPVIFVKYDRFAFRLGDCRVTVDRNVRVVKKGLVKNICPGFCILEVKFINNRLPSVIYDVICRFDLRRVAFSKYYEGVVAIYGRYPRTIIPERFCIRSLV